MAPAVAAAQDPAGSEYVEQVPSFGGGGETTAKPPPRETTTQAPQRQSAPAQSAPAPQQVQTQPVQPTYTAPVAPQPQSKPKPRKRRKPVRPLGAHDSPQVARPSSAPAIDVGSAGSGDSLVWLAALLGAMALVIPATAVYARHHGSR